MASAILGRHKDATPHHVSHIHGRHQSCGWCPDCVAVCGREIPLPSFSLTPSITIQDNRLSFLSVLGQVGFHARCPPHRRHTRQGRREWRDFLGGASRQLYAVRPACRSHRCSRQAVCLVYGITAIIFNASYFNHLPVAPVAQGGHVSSELSHNPATPCGQAQVRAPPASVGGCALAVRVAWCALTVGVGSSASTARAGASARSSRPRNCWCREVPCFRASSTSRAALTR
jgi:hypothetical protein